MSNEQQNTPTTEPAESGGKPSEWHKAMEASMEGANLSLEQRSLYCDGFYNGWFACHRSPTAPPAEIVEDAKALEHRETLAGMLSMATDMKAAWIPWECQIGALRFALDAVDDFKTIEQACFYCAQTEYYGDPERHHHEPEGWHWHHYLDPGDGLPSPCANSDLLERCLEAEIERQTPAIIERFIEEVEKGINIDGLDGRADDAGRIWRSLKEVQEKIQ